MLKIAEDYANEHKIAFSTDTNPDKSKTKGILFCKDPPARLPAPVLLNGNPLPWVSSGKYLGNRLTGNQNGYQKDVTEKRAQFIRKNAELNQEFYFAHPAVKSQINHIYNSSFTGSVLWDLQGEKTKQIVNSWSVAVRHMWNLPVNTHRIFIESLGGTHAQVMLVTRYITFLQSMRRTNKLAVLYLLEKVYLDQNTLTGRNVRYVQDQINEKSIFNVKSKTVKQKYKFEELPVDQKWKVNMIQEIVNIKHNVLVLSNGDQVQHDESVNQLTVDEMNEILSYLATS